MKKVFIIQPQSSNEVSDSKNFELEKLLNSGWTIERCDAPHVAITGYTNIIYGTLVYILKNDSL